MDKTLYENSLSRQVRTLDTLAQLQTARCFDLGKLRACLEERSASGIRRVIVTGCGDSYSAAGAMRPALRELSGIYAVNAPDIIDFCRFYTDRKICGGFRPEEVLVIAVSFSGNSVRAAEALERARAAGAHALLITNAPDSRAAAAAQHVFPLETPAGCNTPGLRSYYASMTALCAIGAYLGLCAGNISYERFSGVGNGIAAYTERFMQDIDRIDEQMFALAAEMKELRRFGVIADWNEGFSAQFVEQKFLECGGVFCDHTTSEEFAHIQFFQRDPAHYGAIMIVSAADPSLGRMQDTVRGCLAQHRLTLVVTDAAPELFTVLPHRPDTSLNFYGSAPIGFDSMAHAGKAVVCTVAQAPERWMFPLADFIPGALLAAYHAAVNERFFFGGRYDFRSEIWKEREGQHD